MLFQEGASEYEEVEKELGSKAAKSGSKGSLNGEGDAKGKSNGQLLRRLFSPVFLEAFVLTFLAEWGDRSQARVPEIHFGPRVLALLEGRKDNPVLRTLFLSSLLAAVTVLMLCSEPVKEQLVSACSGSQQNCSSSPVWVFMHDLLNRLQQFDLVLVSQMSAP